MNTSKYKILLVDDEEDVLEFLSYNLKKEGLNVLTAKNGLEAIEIAKKEHPHLIILDVMMPEMDGMETCENLRSIPEIQDTVIAFLTARNEDYSQVAGFDVGADDYISKPIKPKVLISRIKALLKRVSISGESEVSQSGDVIKIDDLIIDKEKFIVIQSGREHTLPKKEFLLLSLLASKPSRVFERDYIFSKIWGDDIIVGDRTIDVHIRKLREKIGDDYIKTVKGVGYKYESPK